MGLPYIGNRTVIATPGCEKIEHRLQTLEVFGAVMVDRQGDVGIAAGGEH